MPSKYKRAIKPQTRKLENTKIPESKLQEGKSVIFAEEITIARSKSLLKIFKTGARVLNIRLIDSTNPKETVILLKRLTNSIPQLKKAGLSGMTLVTPNQAILNYFRKRLNARLLPVSPGEAELALGAFEIGVQYHAWPSLRVNPLVFRAVVVF